MQVEEDEEPLHRVLEGAPAPASEITEYASLGRTEEWIQKHQQRTNDYLREVDEEIEQIESISVSSPPVVQPVLHIQSNGYTLLPPCDNLNMNATSDCQYVPSDEQTSHLEQLSKKVALAATIHNTSSCKQNSSQKTHKNAKLQCVSRTEELGFSLDSIMCKEEFSSDDEDHIVTTPLLDNTSYTTNLSRAAKEKEDSDSVFDNSVPQLNPPCANQQRTRSNATSGIFSQSDIYGSLCSNEEDMLPSLSSVASNGMHHHYIAMPGPHNAFSVGDGYMNTKGDLGSKVKFKLDD